MGKGRCIPTARNGKFVGKPLQMQGRPEAVCVLPPLFKATQMFQFKLRSHMYMYWKVWTVYMTDKIWFLRREDSEAADRSIDCSYRPVVSSIFTLNLRHKFARSIALSKRTFIKSHIWLRTTDSGYRFWTWIMTATGHWAFYPWTTLSHTPIEIGTSLEPITLVVPTPVDKCSYFECVTWLQF